MEQQKLSPKQIKAEGSFKIGLSLLARDEEDRGYNLIKAAAVLGHRQAQLYFGAKAIEDGKPILGVKYLMKSLDQEGEPPRTIYLPEWTVLHDITGGNSTDSLYAKAMRASPYGDHRNDGKCFTYSAAALTKDPSHPQAGNVSCYLHSLLSRIDYIDLRTDGTLAIMKDKSNIDVDTIPVALNALTAYRRHQSLALQYPTAAALEMKG